MITSLELTNFRSYHHVLLNFPQTTTILIGPNGSGKTNLIESLYFISLLHSFRSPDEQLIRYNQDFFVIERVSMGQTTRLSFQTRQTPHKNIKLNGVKKTAKEMIGYLPIVLFEPSETELFSGSGERRRKLFDRILMQVNRDYLNALIKYRRLIQMRNRLLKAARSQQISHGNLFDQLFVYDLQITEVVDIVSKYRTELVDFINQSLAHSYAEIAAKDTSLSIHYQKSEFLYDHDTIVADIGRGFTSSGPHRDDFIVKSPSTSFTNSASRGEIRTLLLALKLAEYNYIVDQSKKTPILLLDDVFSELDKNRTKNLLKIFGTAQIIITTTEKIPQLGSDIEYIEVKKLANL